MRNNPSKFQKKKGRKGDTFLTKKTLGAASKKEEGTAPSRRLGEGGVIRKSELCHNSLIRKSVRGRDTSGNAVSGENGKMRVTYTRSGERRMGRLYQKHPVEKGGSGGGEAG